MSGVCSRHGAILLQNEGVVGNRRYWLLKSDPAELSIRDLKESPDQTACWDGVRNYQGRNILRDEIRKDDSVLFYHSQVNPAIVGTATVIRAGYPDHTAQDPAGRHFDPRSTPENPIWYMVDIRLEEELNEPLTLPFLRTVPELKDMALLKKGSRLSVQPVIREEFAVVLSLAGSRAADSLRRD